MFSLSYFYFGRKHVSNFFNSGKRSNFFHLVRIYNNILSTCMYVLRIIYSRESVGINVVGNFSEKKTKSAKNSEKKKKILRNFIVSVERFGYNVKTRRYYILDPRSKIVCRGRVHSQEKKNRLPRDVKNF